MDPYIWGIAGLIAIIGVSLPPWSPRGPVELRSAEIGYLRGGSKAAVHAALVALHADGLIEVRKQGGVRRTMRPLSGRTPFERAVYSTLHAPMGPAMIARHPAVRRALPGIRQPLVALGLMPPRWRVLLGFPRRTIAGQRELWALRRTYRRRLAALTEHSPHDPNLDGTLERRVGGGSADSIAQTAVALGLVVNQVANIIAIPEFGGATTYADSGDGGSSADER